MGDIMYHNVLFKLCKKSIPWAREPAGPAGLMTCLLYVESMYLYSDECVSIPSIPLPVYLFTSDGVDIFGKAICADIKVLFWDAGEHPEWSSLVVWFV